MPRSRTAPGADGADALQQARTRARRRLVGATVLLGIGVIAFPLVFETQPRPVPVDIAIEIPRKDGLPPLPMPASAPAAQPAAPAVEPPPAPAEPAAAPAPKPEPTPEPAATAAPKPAPKPSAPAAKAVAESPKPATADAARAKALLEGKPAAPAAADAGRFVVQVGAFADAATARETRLKVEKLGLKTYTQVAETASGSRIRVRLGPYNSREEAEKVLGKTKAAGIDGVVLTL